MAAGDQSLRNLYFTPARCVGMAIFFAGLAYLFFTQDQRHSELFYLAAMAPFLIDHFIVKVRAPQRLPSLSASTSAEPTKKMKLSWITVGALALMLGCLIFINQPRMFAAVAACSLALLMFDGYLQTRSVQ